MGLETGTYISDLNIANPTAADAKSQGDDHLRLLKSTLKATFPLVTGALTATHTELNYVTGVTSSIQGQFTTVQGQFTANGVLITALQTGKADLAGAVYTGTHDFTGAVTTVAAPTLGSHATTRTFVEAQAFLAALPAQAGNAGRYVTTNGTTASWADLSGGITNTTGAANIALTVSSRQLQVITMTADDLTVTLPDATTIAAGGPIYTIYNKGTKNFSVRTFGDAFLVAVLPGQIVTLYCSDKTTAAGFWFVGNETYTGGALQDYAAATAVVINAVSSSETSIIRISDTVAVAAYRGTGPAIQAVCLTVSGVSVSFGLVLTVNATNSTLTSLSLMTSTKFVLAYSGTSGFPEAVILTLTGTTLSKGTICTTISAVTTNSGLSVTALSSTQAIIAYLGASQFVQTSLLDAPSTTITPSVTPLVVNGVASTRPAITAMTSTKALLVYIGSTNLATNVVIDISGATMTPGTVTGFSGAIASARTTLVMLSSTRALFAYLNGTLGVYVLDVAGTVVTPGTVGMGESGFSGTQVNIAILSSTRMIVTYSSGANVRAALMTISGSTPTLGANLYGTQVGAQIASVALTTTKVLSVFAGVSGFLSTQVFEKAE